MRGRMSVWVEEGGREGVHLIKTGDDRRGGG